MVALSSGLGNGRRYAERLPSMMWPTKNSVILLFIAVLATSCSEQTSRTQPMTDSKDSTRTKVVLEIPDAFTSDAADKKYVDPLRQALINERVGTIETSEKGKRKTPEEFSRIITVQLTDYDRGMDVIQRILVETNAPAGTMIVSYNADGSTRDIFALDPTADNE